MIYYTGDIHGDTADLAARFAGYQLTQDDTVVILGDVGANYYAFYGSRKDKRTKAALSSLGAVIFCIHGNHEMRPRHIETYRTKLWHGGRVWYETEFPDLLFAADGDIFDIEGIRHLVIGGAYSVDKFYRIENNYGWWADEQPSEQIKAYTESQIDSHGFDVVLSHTCPEKYIPVEMFLKFVDQSTVDRSTEEWLGRIEESCDYKAWFCGHWHTDKRIDRMHFLYKGVETSQQLKASGEL